MVPSLDLRGQLQSCSLLTGDIGTDMIQKGCMCLLYTSLWLKLSCVATSNGKAIVGWPVGSNMSEERLVDHQWSSVCT